MTNRFHAASGSRAGARPDGGRRRRRLTPLAFECCETRRTLSASPLMPVSERVGDAEPPLAMPTREPPGTTALATDRAIPSPSAASNDATTAGHPASVTGWISLGPGTFGGGVAAGAGIHSSGTEAPHQPCDGAPPHPGVIAAQGFPPSVERAGPAAAIQTGGMAWGTFDVDRRDWTAASTVHYPLYSGGNTLKNTPPAPVGSDTSSRVFLDVGPALACRAKEIRPETGITGRAAFSFARLTVEGIRTVRLTSEPDSSPPPDRTPSSCAPARTTGLPGASRAHILILMSAAALEPKTVASPRAPIAPSTGQQPPAASDVGEAAERLVTPSVTALEAAKDALLDKAGTPDDCTRRDPLGATVLIALMTGRARPEGPESHRMSGRHERARLRPRAALHTPAT